MNPKKSRIGLGLAAIGRPEYINIRQNSDPDKSFSVYREKALELLDFAYNVGVRDFDTAASYGKGEQFLYNWYDRRQYDDLRLSSKWGYTYMADWRIGYSGAHEIKEHSLAKLEEQWSFARKMLPGLKTYQIHSATFESGVLENDDVHEKLADLKSRYGIRIGASVSGSNQAEVLVAASSLKVKGKLLFDSFQVTYNLLDSSTHSILNDLLDSGIEIIIKEALANGRLLRNKNFDQYDRLYKLMDDIAARHDVGADAVALRYVFDSLEPTIVLSGASNKNQLLSNMKAQNFELNEEELESLRLFQVSPDDYWSERKSLPWN